MDTLSTSFTAATTRPACLWFRLVDGEGSPAELMTIEAFDRRLGFLVIVHLYKTEPPGLSGEPVRNDGRGVHYPDLGKSASISAVVALKVRFPTNNFVA